MYFHCLKIIQNIRKHQLSLLYDHVCVSILLCTGPNGPG